MKKVVIIGGGFTGANAAKRLQYHFNVTLIDSKNYFEFTPSVLRTVVDTSYTKSIQAVHSDYLPNAKVFVEKVIDITKKSVVTNKKEHKYDYLIIASGSEYNLPFKEDNCVMSWRANHLQEFHDTLEKSKKVLIVGGGIVGVEIAGEIAEHYKDKEITLLHSRNELMPRNNAKTRHYTKKILEKKGVKFIWNRRIEKKEGEEFCTTHGEKLKADIAYLCIGIKPNYAFMQKHFKEKLDDRHYIKTNDFLQLEGETNIFVGGDITNIKEEKLAQTAEDHAAIICKNIFALESKKPLTKYISTPKPVVISLGEHLGVFEYKNFVLTGWIPSLIKKFVQWKTMRKFR